MKYIVCYSGGESSAICAEYCIRQFGKKNVILLNHNLSGKVEHQDIKRFKNEIAERLDLPITYANAESFEKRTPLEVCREIGAFLNPDTRQALCTYYLKTLPFAIWLKENYPIKQDKIREDIRIVYGFDFNETDRITRRVGVMANQGYQCYFPRFEAKNDCLNNIEAIGVKKPITYKIYKHANCQGCLKAGIQHWYTIYCLRQDIFKEAVQAENEIGYTILKENSLEEMVPRFEEIKSKGICPNDKDNSSFWKRVNSVLPEQISYLPCDCALL